MSRELLYLYSFKGSGFRVQRFRVGQRTAEPQPATSSAVSNVEGWIRFAQSFLKIDRSTQKLTTGRIHSFDPPKAEHSWFDIRYSFFMPSFDAEPLTSEPWTSEPRTSEPWTSEPRTRERLPIFYWTSCQNGIRLSILYLWFDIWYGYRYRLKCIGGLIHVDQILIWARSYDVR